MSSSEVGEIGSTIFNWGTIRGILFSDLATDTRVREITLVVEGGVPVGVTITAEDGRKLTIREKPRRIHAEWDMGFDSGLIMEVLKTLDTLGVI